MKRETAEKARYLLNELDKLKSIKSVTDTEGDSWWALATPVFSKIIHMENSSTIFPERLRKGFVELVNKTIAEAEEELENLKDE